MAPRPGVARPARGAWSRTENRFTKVIVATLAKRAANRCSNPDCTAITSGPAKKRTASVNVGEAAHIYGANVGSARYESTMEPAERRSIENAIWLCGNCHKLIDDDPARYPAGLLFEWQREHERQIMEQVGKAGAELRRRYEERHFEELGKISYLSERIIREKEPFWEYRLTGEALRSEMAPVLRKWDSLRRGLYMRPNYRVIKEESVPWMQSRISEVMQITQAFSELMNVEFGRSWGEPGVPGDEMLIISTCRLFSGVCQSAVDWEEAVRFANVDAAFEEVKDLFVGIAGGLIDEAAKVPQYMAEVFANDPQPGVYNLSLVLTLPDGWIEALTDALARAAEAWEAG